MSKENDQYDFSQKSRFGLDGYECFFNKESQFYYFHFNDEKGKALLYSQGYKTMNGRDNGLKSVSMNRREPAHYKMLEEENLNYFIIQAKNGHEIARSRYFKKKTKMMDQMKYIQKFNYEDATILENDYIDDVQEIYQEEVPFSKNIFRLCVYNDSDPKILIGKIEHLTSQKKYSFQGLGGAELMEFVTTCISENSTSIESPMDFQTIQETEVVTIQETTVEQLESIEIKEPEPEVLVSEEIWTIDNESIVKRNVIRSITYHRDLANHPIEVKLLLDSEKKEGSKFYTLNLDVFNVDNGALLYNCKYHNAIPKNGALKFDLPSQILDQGLYKLAAELFLTTTHNDLDKIGTTINESKLFQI